MNTLDLLQMQKVKGGGKCDRLMSRHANISDRKETTRRNKRLTEIEYEMYRLGCDYN